MILTVEQIKKKTFENEDQLQAFCVLMISQLFPRLRGKFFHVKNEQHIPKKDGETPEAYKKRALISMGREKAKGLLPGVPDLPIKHNGILYPVELKLDAVVSPNQADLHLIWNADCPQIPVRIFKDPYSLYCYCRWILDTDLKIDFSNLKPFIIS